MIIHGVFGTIQSIIQTLGRANEQCSQFMPQVLDPKIKKKKYKPSPLSQPKLFVRPVVSTALLLLV